MRVAPNAVTALGFLVAAGAAATALPGGRWLALTAALVVVSGVVDNLDGAVAVMSGRVSAWGHVLDSVVDRCSDAVYLIALWLAGAPAGVCVGAGFVAGLAEYVRARAGVAGLSEVGVVTVFERPTRIIVTAMFLLGAAIWTAQAAGWAGAGAWAWLALALVGIVQLVVVVRRRLR
jgi:CDP-diacylglycerol--glycerol-3-phosphate 3-phosphatidyltransferase